MPAVSKKHSILGIHTNISHTHRGKNVNNPFHKILENWVDRAQWFVCHSKVQQHIAQRAHSSLIQQTSRHLFSYIIKSKSDFSKNTFIKVKNTYLYPKISCKAGQCKFANKTKWYWNFIKKRVCHLQVFRGWISSQLSMKVNKMQKESFMQATIYHKVSCLIIHSYVEEPWHEVPAKMYM